MQEARFRTILILVSHFYLICGKRCIVGISNQTTEDNMQKIQKDRADRLEKFYGDTPCPHTDGYYEEYVQKGDTGVYRCKTCYRGFAKAELNKRSAGPQVSQ